MTQSGKYDRRIILGKKELKKDSQGFQSYEFKQIAKPWANIRTTTDNAKINEDKESVMDERVMFEIYYRPGVTKNMSIIFRDQEYQITAIFNPGFRDEKLILTGERQQSRGDINGQRK